MPGAMDAERKTSFPPIVRADTRVLVLGSLPGERSLAAARYYAHPQNQFWRLAGAAIGRELAALPYEQRLATLLAAGVGLWDVVASAARRGSSDAALRDVAANDLAALAAGLRRLHAVAFNGAAAARIGTAALGDVPVTRIVLPSSSPLHTIGFAAKLPAWMAIGTHLDFA